MSSAQQVVATEAGKLAGILPFPLLQMLAESINDGDITGWSQFQNRITQQIHHAQYRSLTANFLELWRSQAKSMMPQAVALALLTAGYARSRTRGERTSEVEEEKLVARELRHSANNSN